MTSVNYRRGALVSKFKENIPFSLFPECYAGGYDGYKVVKESCLKDFLESFSDAGWHNYKCTCKDKGSDGCGWCAP
jgi:hypothetical protein